MSVLGHRSRELCKHDLYDHSLCATFSSNLQPSSNNFNQCREKLKKPSDITKKPSDIKSFKKY